MTRLFVCLFTKTAASLGHRQHPSERSIVSTWELPGWSRPSTDTQSGSFSSKGWQWNLYLCWTPENYWSAVCALATDNRLKKKSQFWILTVSEPKFCYFVKRQKKKKSNDTIKKENHIFQQNNSNSRFAGQIWSTTAINAAHQSIHVYGCPKIKVYGIESMLMFTVNINCSGSFVGETYSNQIHFLRK